MKKIFALLLCVNALTAVTTAQVTQLNNNSSLELNYPIGNNKAVLKSGTNRLWVTDATAAGTFQLSAVMEYESGGGVLNNKFIFPGTTAANGAELWISDGTVAGTSLLKDINPGTAGSFPDDDFALLNGFLYFTAETPEAGRELWRTDGTANGTTLVKDIMPGPAQSALRGKYDIFSTGTYLLLNIATAAAGYELWRSDGTANGTIQLKDINAGPLSSDAGSFVKYNNLVLFSAKDAAHGLELWKTDGTEAGTQLVKDINPGVGNAFFYLYILQFNNKAFLVANDGTHGDEMWSTDGSTANTFLVKDIQPGAIGAFFGSTLINVVKCGSKFIFTAYNQAYDVELWESDGTTAGTKLFKEIASGSESGIPFLLVPYDITNPGNQKLFNTNKFFFLMVLPSSGFELWISDGTAAGTTKVKTINPAETDGLDNLSYAYTEKGLYFTGDDATYGEEIWKSDGTAEGTSMIIHLNPGTGNAGTLFYWFALNNKLIFEATNGDGGLATDLYAIDAGGDVLPVKMGDFTGTLQSANALLNWYTLQEVQSRDFTIQRSFDGTHFTGIASVVAAGSSAAKRRYSYTDVNIVNTKNEWVYYRLLLNDIDGKSTYSKVISLRLHGATDWSIGLVTNPVSNNIQVNVNGVSGDMRLSIKDLSGKTLFTSSVTVNGLVQVPADKLAPGVYLLTAENNKEIKTVKFMKQ